MNIVQTWLFLIGTPQRALALRKRLDALRPAGEGLPSTCPTVLLFGQYTSNQLYTRGWARPALDAWDTGALTKDDLRRFALAVERAQYDGPAFDPRLVNGRLADGAVAA